MTSINGWFRFGYRSTAAAGTDPAGDDSLWRFNSDLWGDEVRPGDLERAPARDYSTTSAPARNGLVLTDNQRYPNVDRSYWVMFRNNFYRRYRTLRAYLLPRVGYQRLVDSWNPTEFYDAYVSADLQPVVSRNRDRGSVLVTFSRRPQRWLWSGERAITSPSDYKPDYLQPYDELLANNYISKPLILYNFNSSRIPTNLMALKLFTLGGLSVWIVDRTAGSGGTAKTVYQILSDAYWVVAVDCETMVAYRGNMNYPFEPPINLDLNRYIMVTSSDVSAITSSTKASLEFPRYDYYGSDGSDDFAFNAASYATSYALYPRWYTI